MASRRHAGWLIDELPGLVEEGVLEPDQAERLRAHYADAVSSQDGVGGRVLGVLGASLVGLGIILLVAANWESLDRVARTALCFALILGGQGVALFAMLRHPMSTAWTEGSALFLSFAVGAALAMIGQTYQLAGDVPSFLFTWMLLSIPLIYALRSRGVAALGLVALLFIAGGSAEGVRLMRFGVGLLGIAPFLIWLRTHDAFTPREAFLGLVASVAVPLGLFIAVEAWSSVWVLTVAAAAAGALLSLGAIEAPRVTYYARPGFGVGLIASAGLVLYLSYADDWGFATESASPQTLPAQIVGLLAGLGFATLAALGTRAWWRKPDPPLAGLSGFFGLVALATLLLRAGVDLWVPVVAVNLWGGVIAIAGIVSGIRTGSVARTNLFLLLLCALIFARFGDIHWSFAARGVVFIALGAGFLALNLRLRRASVAGETR